MELNLDDVQLFTSVEAENILLKKVEQVKTFGFFVEDSTRRDMLMWIEVGLKLCIRTRGEIWIRPMKNFIDL